MKIKLFFLFLIAFSICSFGQSEENNYKRELKDVDEQWHKIIIPNEMFSKLSSNLTDIRIKGVTKENDTLEIPYLINIVDDKKTIKDQHFKLINKSKNNKGYYFTFQMISEDLINEIILDLKQDNFDWLLTLEGGQNLTNWFTIVNDYRIVSINTDFTNYSYTSIKFSDSKYKYFRVFIKTAKNLDLLSAKIYLKESVKAELRNYEIKNIKKEENKKSKQSEIEVELEMSVPVSNIKIKAKNSFDFYRPFKIKYLKDSLKTKMSWKYIYKNLTSGTLNSIEKNDFKFRSVVLKKFKIIINNNDNKPLYITDIEVNGEIYELNCRFPDTSASYFITYGNLNLKKPIYDISKFANKIPENLSEISIEEEIKIEKTEISKIEPLFKSKIWLWAIMTIFILFVGWFSLKMIKTK